jgi:hypothetical protein
MAKPASAAAGAWTPQSQQSVMAWTANIAAKVRWQPMRSDMPPQKKRPTALKILTIPNRGAISAGARR